MLIWIQLKPVLEKDLKDNITYKKEYEKYEKFEEF